MFACVLFLVRMVTPVKRLMDKLEYITKYCYVVLLTNFEFLIKGFMEIVREFALNILQGLFQSS